MLIGYARVSTHDQTLHLQQDALEKIGCAKIFTDTASGAITERRRLGGRPKAKTLNTPKKVAMAQSLYDNKNNTIDEICKTLNISRSTLYRYIKVGQRVV